MEILNIFDSIRTEALIAGSGVALGMLLLWFGLFQHILWPERVDVRALLGEEEDEALPEKIDLSDRTIRGLASYIEQRQRKEKLEELENMLVALGRPAPYTDVAALYSQAVLSGLIFALMSGILVTVAVIFLELPIFLYVVVFVLGYIGYQIPFNDVKSRVEARRKGMIIELPSLMSQLLIAYNATNSLPSAMIAVVSRPTPMSGYLFAEMRKIVDDYTMGGESLPQAIRKAEERTRDVPIVSRALARLRTAEETGMPLNTALRAIVQRSYQYLEYQLTVITQRNQTLSLMPVSIAILTVLLQTFIPFLNMASGFMN